MKIQLKKLTPRSLPASGGSAFISVNVTGRGITKVEAIATLAGGSSTTVLHKAAGKRYQGSMTVPGNPLLRTAEVAISVRVTTGSGTTSKNVGRISIGASSSTQPPSPPTE